MESAIQSEYSTIADIYALPEGRHAELIEGRLYMMALPGRVHQEIVSELHYLIRDYRHARAARVRRIGLRAGIYEDLEIDFSRIPAE